jgi:transposase-like protein
MEKEELNLASLAKHFSDEDKARGFLEAQRWPEGPICPHCGELNNAYRLEPTQSKKNAHVRKGVWKCGGCREQFSVTVGTIMEDSHIPLTKWLLAFHLLCASKKGMSAHQLHRMLKVTYKSAWFMAHRIRYAMSQEPLSSKLSGTVEVDETYIGGKEKGNPGRPTPERSKKTPVVAMVERTLINRKGRVRSLPMARVTADNLKPVLKQYLEQGTALHTDEAAVYYFCRDAFPDHSVIRHKDKQYSTFQDGKLVTTNTVEGFFSILKRGINGVYHHVGRGHLHRYLSEFDFRYNSRDQKDGARTLLAIKGVEGKRLTYRDSLGKAHA